jgi:putative FmdB family regulatory protein
MPIYEYYCAECNGVFEQLLPVKRASEPQPCPQCDSESRRIMPTEFQAFTFREGAPRRIPDRGTYWHFEQEVRRPVNEEVQLNEHPDLIYEKYGPDHPPTVEEQERYAEQLMDRLQYEEESLASGRTPDDVPVERHRMQEFIDRTRKTAAAARELKKKQPNAASTPKTRTGKHAPTEKKGIGAD